MWMYRHSGSPVPARARKRMPLLPGWQAALAVVLGTALAAAQPAVLSTAQPTAPEHVVPIASLHAEHLSAGTHVTVQGVITRTGVPLYLQDRSGGLEITSQPAWRAFQIGDEVRVTGIPTPTRYSSSLRADSIRLLRARIPDPPVAITPGMGASGDYDRLLVDTDGTLQRFVQLEGRSALLLYANHQTFLVQPSQQDENASQAALEPGSRLRVRGVCVMSEGDFAYPVAFRVMLRSAQDITLLAGPPFWTRSHLLWMCGALMLLVFVALMLTRRFERWRFGIILDERARLAHDLHDTLAQSFAGIAFQLQAIRSAVRKKKSDADIDSHVELAIGMVSHSHEDARRSIAMLKPVPPFSGDLLLQLREQAELLTRGGDIQVEVVSAEEPEHIEPATRNALLRIGHEAITNTVRHASASRVTLSLHMTQQHLHLMVVDNGCGFVHTAGHLRGFGIHGMQARAASCGGSVAIRSAAMEGCTVEVILPLHDRRRQARHWFMLLLNGKQGEPGITKTL